MQKLKDMGADDNTIVRFSPPTTAPKSSPGPMADRPRSRSPKGRSWRAVSACRVSCAGPAMCRRTPFRTVFSPVWTGSPPSLDAAGNPNITDQLLEGVKLGDRTYRNHLDGDDQMAAITGKGPSTRHEIFYLGESTVGAVRIDDYKFRFIDQPQGWLGDKTKPDVPYIDQPSPRSFERTGWPRRWDARRRAAILRLVQVSILALWFVQQVMGKELQTFLDYRADAKGARASTSMRWKSGDGEKDAPGGGARATAPEPTYQK